MDKNCTTCGKAVFDKIWGDYKCTAFHVRVQNPLNTGDCGKYVKGTPGEAKDEDFEMNN
jgi:hypothetical protein